MPSLLIYYAAAFFQGVCVIFMPASSAVLKSPQWHGLSDFQYGLLFLAQVIMAVIASSLTQKTLAQRGRAFIYRVGLFSNLLCMGFIGLTLLFLTKSGICFVLLFIANGFLGVGFGFLVSILNINCVELYPNKKDSILTSLHGVIGLGASLSPQLAGRFFDKGIWEFAPLIPATGLTFLFGFSYLIKQNLLPAKNLDGQAVPQLTWSLKVPKIIWGFLGIILTYGVIESLLGNWTLLYLREEKNFSMSEASLGLSLFWISLTAGKILASAITVRVDAKYLYRLSPLGMVIGLWYVVTLKDPSQIPFAYIFLGLGASCFLPLSLSLAIRYEEQWEEFVSSMGLAALMIGVGFGSTLTGLLKSYMSLSLKEAFLAGLCLAVMLAISAQILTQKPKDQEPKPLPTGP